MLYITSVILLLTISVIIGSEDFLYYLPSVLSIVIIALYNGQRGKNMLWLRNVFYLVYPPLQLKTPIENGMQLSVMYDTGKYDLKTWRITYSKEVRISAVIENAPKGTEVLV